MAGTIVSSEGDPLPGVNILIDGTELGTASGGSGEYFILNIPPGRLTVRYMMIGRKTHVQQDVVIVADFTTTVDIVLEQISLNAEEEVMVTAERPLIQRDATSTVKVIDAETIVDMPAVDFKDVLVTQAGFTTDASGGIHVRGGRTKEILYMIDGIVVRDPLLGDFSGSVNQNAIQQMTVISGTFNAEYGQAMSSVVNIVTKEGGGDFHGKLEHITGRLNESPYHSVEAFDEVPDTNYVWQDLGTALHDYLPENLLASAHSPLISLSNINVNGSVSLNMGGRLPVINTDFFMSGFYGSNDSYLPHGSDVNQDVQIKLTRRLTSKIKLSGHLHSSNRLYQRYSHKWKYLPLHQSHTFKSNDRWALSFTHTLGHKLFYSLSLSEQTASTLTAVMDKTPEEYERSQTGSLVYFYDEGDEGIFSDNSTTSRTANFDVNYQLNHRHLLKSGFTFTKHNMGLYTEEEPWQGGTNFKDDTNLL